MSEEWGELSPERIGRATASRIKDVIATTKGGGYSTSRANYRAELVAERLTGVPYPGPFKTAAMIWGTENEPLARVAYELHANFTVEKAGFVHHPTISMSGGSPDGLVGNEGMVQFKCPLTSTHIASLQGEPISDAYIVQLQWEMACTKRMWSDWVSFDPRLPEEMRLFVKRVPRDNKRIHDLEEEVQTFLAEVEATVIYLRHKYQRDAA